MTKHTELIKQIHQLYNGHTHTAVRPFVVALDGLSGAGKTTLVTQLQQHFQNAVVIHIDDHIVEHAKRYNTGYVEWIEYYNLQWDLPFLTKILLQAIRDNAPYLQLPYYLKEMDTTIEKTVMLQPNCIVLIEGIFLLRNEWKHYYDFSIFLDCPKEVRFQRVCEREKYVGDMQERIKKYNNRYWPAEEYYLKTQKPLDVADFVLQSHEFIF